MFVNNVPSGIIEVLVKQEASAALEHEGNIRNISIIIFQFNSLIYMYIKQAVDKSMEAKSIKRIILIKREGSVVTFVSIQ